MVSRVFPFAYLLNATGGAGAKGTDGLVAPDPGSGVTGKGGTFPSSGMTQVLLGIPASPPRGARRTVQLAWRENRLIGLKLHFISNFTRLLQTANEKQNKNNCINMSISI